MDHIMEQVHKIQLEMALEVKRICEKHSIKYSIIAGTLLGAVRHKGFIPWDDDLDIGMLREDYEKFIAVSVNELKDEYFLQTWETDPNFALPIAKLRKNDTKYIEQNSSKANIHNGIYIDIFPYDNVPSSLFLQKVQNGTTYILKRIILVKQNYEVWNENERFKKLIYELIGFITKPMSIERTKQLLYKHMIKYNTDITEKIVIFGGAYGYWKESIQRSWLANLSNIEFEDNELLGPQDYSDYLTYYYGDYMIPPPENKRYNRHQIIEIKFE